MLRHQRRLNSNNPCRKLCPDDILLSSWVFNAGIYIVGQKTYHFIIDYNYHVFVVGCRLSVVCLSVTRVYVIVTKQLQIGSRGFQCKAVQGLDCQRMVSFKTKFESGPWKRWTDDGWWRLLCECRRQAGNPLFCVLHKHMRRYWSVCRHIATYWPAIC